MTHPATSLPVLSENAKNIEESRRKSIADDLTRLQIGQVRFTQHERQLYATDASLYQVEPIGVVIPANTSCVAPIIGYCAARKLAVLPRGGGTSLAGQCTNHAIVVDLSPSCRGVLQIDINNKQCTVEPGIGIDELNRHLDAKRTGYFFAPDPATSAQASVGGCIGNNAAGARSIRYGRTSENIAAVEVVLSSGQRVWLEPGAGRKSTEALTLARQVAEVVRENSNEIRTRFPKLIRRNAGYGLDLILQQIDRGVADEDLDLSGLICGSEGTLAIVVAAKLNLHPLPMARGLAVVSFNDLDAAMEAVCRILESQPSAVELLDEEVIRAALGNAECRAYVDMLPTVGNTTPRAVLYVEYQAFHRIEELHESFAALKKILPDAPMLTFDQPAAMARAWTLRKSSEALLHGLPGHAKPVTFVEDNSVPVEQLRKFVAEFKKIVERHGTTAAYYAHASVGVLHIRPMLNLHEPLGRKKMQAIALEAAELARSCGGVMSGEHGDGRVRGPLLANFYGAPIMAAFKQIKNIFDPAGILNPGNIVDAGPIASITQNLRVDANSPAIDLAKIDTFFEYKGEEGFAGAVEQCNGSGFCRKTAVGVMCPSYRATLDERHSTRGRANAMRLAITGQTSPDEHASTPQWNDPAVLQTLDLCLSCKACKTECPSNVDVAQLKSEYYSQHHRAQGGASLKARLFGNVRQLNQLGAIAPGFANWVNNLPPVRWLIGQMLDLAPQRKLPAFAPSLYQWFANRSAPKTGTRRVALWADCFVTYNEPQIGKAATHVLEALGYSVELPRGGCCGRPMMSLGLLDQAIATADQTLAAMRPWIDDPAVESIIVLEPSCLSAIKDEWLKLKLKTDMATRQRLADKAMLIEQFIEGQWDKHPVSPRIHADSSLAKRSMIVHGHCHQKALWGMDTTAALLRRIAGDKLDVLPSGCCGMAGSFGYTKDRYKLSMDIGEQSVFPPIRAAAENAVVVAPGTSCRHQIKDGTGRESLHPAQVLAAALISEKNVE